MTLRELVAVDEAHADAVAELIRSREEVADFSIAGMKRGWQLTIRTTIGNKVVYCSTVNGRAERYAMIVQLAKMIGVSEDRIEQARMNHGT